MMIMMMSMMRVGWGMRMRRINDYDNSGTCTFPPEPRSRLVTRARDENDDDFER